MSMAEQIEQFQKRTPTRYHLRSRQSQERGGSKLQFLMVYLTLTTSMLVSVFYVHVLSALCI